MTTPPDSSYRETLLSKGKYAKIDHADFEWLSQWKWSALEAGPGKFYAVRTETNHDGKRVFVYMHRAILGLTGREFCDHVNGDGLDNRRHNLRRATPQQNRMNTGRAPHNKSGYKGVSFRSQQNLWVAQFWRGTIRRKAYFKTPEDAAIQYDHWASAIDGEFAHLNFPQTEK